LKKKIYE